MKGCLTCKHCVLTPPPGWKEPCEGYSFDEIDVKRIIEKERRHQAAQCAFNPVWVPVQTNHYCGRWAANLRLEWREGDVKDFIWGTYAEQRSKEWMEEAKTLRLQLKKSRELSASRLARLNKAKRAPNGAAHE
jgi:hypothetical protein